MAALLEVARQHMAHQSAAAGQDNAQGAQRTRIHGSHCVHQAVLLFVQPLRQRKKAAKARA
jgi:hypothetical protein